ncbi:MAG: helix-turn-helix domain-containing protein [Panacagrimonas sp.]
MSLGARLKDERLRLSLSQTALAEFGDQSKRAQIYYEQDAMEPGAKYLAGIASAGVDVQYVLTGVRSLNHASPRIQAVAKTFAALSPANQDEAQKMVTAKAANAKAPRRRKAA